MPNPATWFPPLKSALVRRLTSANNNCNCKYRQEKFSNATIALKNDSCPAIGRLQKLHQGRTQDFVQADKFLSLFAQSRRRPDGRAVFQAHCRLRRDPADVPRDGSALG